MIKEKRILFYFICWLFIGFFLIFIGVRKTYADTIKYENIGYISDYTIFYMTDTNTSGTPTQLNQYTTYNLQNVTQFLVYIENYNFNANVTYDLEIYMAINSIKSNSKFIITDKNYNTCKTYELLIEDSHYPRFRFSCPEDTDYISMTIYNDTNNYVVDNGNFSWNYTYLKKEVSSIDFGPIIEQNQQIIQGQEEIKDTIKNELNSCRQSVNLFNYDNVTIEKGSIGSDGLFIPSSSRIRIYNINLLNNTKYTISTSNNNLSVVPYFYDSNGNFISYDSGWKNLPYTFTMPSNASILKLLFKNNITDDISITDISNLQIQKGSVATKYEPYGEQICNNKIDETNDKLDETNQNLGDIKDSLTDSSPTDMSGLGDSAGWLPAGPVDSILTLPLTMLNSLVNNLSNNSCQNISIELPFVKENITLPCIRSLYDKMGVTGTLFTTAGLIGSAFILFNYLLALYKWVDDTLTMRENTMPGYFDDNWGGGA